MKLCLKWHNLSLLYIALHCFTFGRRIYVRERQTPNPPDRTARKIKKMKRLSLFTICLIILIGSWVVLRFVVGGIVSVPIPGSVIAMYMGLILIAVLVHISVEDSLFREFLRPSMRHSSITIAVSAVALSRY